jgi:hypothetical protein
MMPSLLRKRLAALLLLVGTGLIVLASQGQPPAPRSERDEGGEAATLRTIEEVNAASEKALDFLEQKQNKDGTMAGAWSNNMAVNALAMLAFLSHGHVPGRGKYGDTIEDDGVRPGVLTRAKRFILSRAQPTGFIASSSMYEHGLATLALAEMYGMDPDRAPEDKLRQAVDLIVKTQSPAGGWRYSPTPSDQDLSVTIMQVVALRAANNAEIPVPATTFDKAVKYVHSCADPAGGYGYQGPGRGPQTSAAGVLALQLLGKPEDPGIPKAIAYLETIPVQWEGNNPNYFYYFHYYAIQAFYQAGGKAWNSWHPRVRKLLLSHREPDGSWNIPPGSAEVGALGADGPVYATAMATLILNIYMHYLPAYQR